mmetsp:Transcript_1746/g.2568  ORF Transcript_1746/g.2568 Transcript_1746/m.2568 type:complete len:85 (+) Transcript_1746:966-1220(+)
MFGIMGTFLQVVRCNPNIQDESTLVRRMVQPTKGEVLACTTPQVFRIEAQDTQGTLRKLRLLAPQALARYHGVAPWGFSAILNV